MKICPLCKMTVDAESDCPICHTTITYEPDQPGSKEKYVFSKYLILYLIKLCWFSLLCLLFVLVRLFLSRPELRSDFWMPFLFAVVSLIYSLFQRKIAKFGQWKYSENYSGFRTAGVAITTGILAVVFSLVIH